MMIDKIGGLNPLNNVQNIRKTDNAAKVSSQTDSISVSKEAVEKAEETVEEITTEADGSEE